MRLNGELCLDPARRLKEGDVVALLAKPERVPRSHTDELTIRHLDDHLVVVEKPAGISTTRHPAERDWTPRRRALTPTLEDRLQQAIALKLRVPPHKLPRRRRRLSGGFIRSSRLPRAR